MATYVLVSRPSSDRSQDFTACYPQWTNEEYDEDFVQNGDALAIRLDLWLKEGELVLKRALKAGLTYKEDLWDGNLFDFH